MKKEKSGDYSKKILKCLAVFIVAYIMLNTYTFLKTGQEQTVMVSLIIGTVCAEIFNLANIKKTKIKHAYNKLEEESEEVNEQ